MNAILVKLNHQQTTAKVPRSRPSQHFRVRSWLRLRRRAPTHVEDAL